MRRERPLAMPRSRTSGSSNRNRWNGLRSAPAALRLVPVLICLLFVSASSALFGNSDAAFAQTPPAAKSPAAKATPAEPPVVASAEPSEPKTPAMMIVFDGSGSMWGRLASDNAVKLNMARDAVRKSWPKLGTSVRVGLASFGHNRKGDCGDTEVILDPATGDVGRFMTPLDKLNPKGRGPLVEALKEAAGEFAADTDSAQTMLLIHDDADNCQRDACAAATEIKRDHPKLVIHVLGLGLSQADSQRMACVPQITGGKFFDAQDSATVGQAMEEVFQLASANGAPVAPNPSPANVAGPPAKTPVDAIPTASARPAPPLPPNLRPPGPPGLRLMTALVTGGPALDIPVRWRVWREGDGAGAPLVDTRAATIDLDIPPGKYFVEARQGLVSARRSVEALPNVQVPVLLALNAGALERAAVSQKSGVVVAPTVTITSTTTQAAPGDSPNSVIWPDASAREAVLLPPGSWRIVSEIGAARTEQVVTVTAGLITDLGKAFAVGHLRLRAVDREGGQTAQRVNFRIWEDDPESPNGRREVARSAAAEPVFTLPPGTYFVVARQGSAEVRERVLLNGGDDVARTFILSLGRLTMQSQLQGAAGSISTDPVTYRVLRLDPPPATTATIINGTGNDRSESGPVEVARTGAPMATLDLAAGRYRIESQLGGQNARAVRTVEIRPGATQAITIDYPAARVHLRLVGNAARAATSDLYWDIRDSSDNSVWRTVQAEPRAFLAAGRYKLRIETRDRRYDTTFEVKAGENLNLDLDPPG
jgi:Ca-activated chloride channel homolog